MRNIQKFLGQKKFNPLKFISMHTEIVKRIYYKPENIWFDNRKEAKEYLGGRAKFDKALKNNFFIFYNI